jgi:hypothetical protein
MGFVHGRSIFAGPGPDAISAVPAGHSGHSGGEQSTGPRPPRLSSRNKERDGLQAAHGTELVPAGLDQGRHFPPLGDGFGGIAPMPQGVPVAGLTTAPISAAVKPTASPSRHGRRLTRHPAPVPRPASRALVHGQAAVHGLVPPVSMPPPPPPGQGSHRH